MFAAAAAGNQSLTSDGFVQLLVYKLQRVTASLCAFCGRDSPSCSSTQCDFVTVFRYDLCWTLVQSVATMANITGRYGRHDRVLFYLHLLRGVATCEVAALLCNHRPQSIQRGLQRQGMSSM